MHVSPQALPFLHILQQAILVGSRFKPGICIMLKDGSKSLNLTEELSSFNSENPKIKLQQATVTSKYNIFLIPILFNRSKFNLQV